MGSSDLKLLLIAGLIMKLLLSPLSSLPVSLLPSLATTTVIVVVTRVMVTGPGDTMARGRPSPRQPLLLRPMLRLMLMPTTEATMAMALAMVLAMAMADMDSATDMEDMVDTVLDSMARERLSPATMGIMVTREDTDTEQEDTDTTMARERRMLSLATMDITVTRAGDTDTGPEDTDTTMARGRPSLDMATVMAQGTSLWLWSPCLLWIRRQRASNEVC